MLFSGLAHSLDDFYIVQQRYRGLFVPGTVKLRTRYGSVLARGLFRVVTFDGRVIIDSATDPSDYFGLTK